MLNLLKDFKSVPVAVCLALFLLYGCQLEPPYHPPEVEIPTQWKYKQEEEGPPIPINHWWEIFQDSGLNQLEVEAIANNPGLFAVLERVVQARAFAGIVRSQLFPQLDLVPYFFNKEYLAEKFTNTGNYFLREHKREYAVPLKITYEADLWSQYRNEYRSAKRSAEAQAFDYQSALLVLTTDLAAAYFQLRIQDTLIKLFETTLETRKKALSINQSRFRNQIISYNAVALATLDLSDVQSQYEDAIRGRALLENSIAVLIGIPPEKFSLQSSAIYEMPPKIPAGLPSDIIQNRPDLAAQERIIAAIHARIGVAYASYFPSIELIGQEGILSPALRKFLTVQSLFWMVGANIAQYVFDAGARDCNVKMTWAEYCEAVAIYKQKVLVAFGEVENALMNIEQLSKEMDAVYNSVRAAQKAYSIAFHRYFQGVGFYLEVVDDERQLLDHQRLYTSLLGLSYLNTIQLLKALGGEDVISNIGRCDPQCQSLN
jgi:outer membrane protein, multidrug efflux system